MISGSNILSILCFYWTLKKSFNGKISALWPQEKIRVAKLRFDKTEMELASRFFDNKGSKDGNLF